LEKAKKHYILLIAFVKVRLLSSKIFELIATGLIFSSSFIIRTRAYPGLILEGGKMKKKIQGGAKSHFFAPKIPNFIKN